MFVSDDRTGKGEKKGILPVVSSLVTNFVESGPTSSQKCSCTELSSFVRLLSEPSGPPPLIFRYKVQSFF